MVTIFPETSRSIVGNGSVPPPKWNRSLYQAMRKTPDPGDARTLEKRKPNVNPFAALQLLGDKSNCILAVYTGILYAGYASIASVLAAQLVRRYHFNAIQSGLCYIPLGVGALSSRLTMGVLIDWNFKRDAKTQGLEITKNKQQEISQLNVEAARLSLAFPAMLGCCCCVIAYGWIMEYRTPLAALLVRVQDQKPFLTHRLTTASL